jgi:hypothetical protein
MEMASVKRTSRLAVASMICIPTALAFVAVSAFLTLVGAHRAAGISIIAGAFLFGVAFFLGLLSLVVIVVWHKQVRGCLCGILAILLSAPVIYVLCSIWCAARVREKHKKEWTGLYNLELLGEELFRYAKAHDGCLPVAGRWCDLLMEHNKNLTKENFRHPQPEIFRDTFNFKEDCQFAFNKNLSGMRLADLPGNVVLLFEADGDWNLSGTSELLKTRYREKGYIAMLFVDQTVNDYWYYVQEVRKFDPKGTHMYYEKPRWQP